MLKKRQTRKEEDIELLNDFKNTVCIWRRTRTAALRSDINTKLPRIRKILSVTGSNKYMTLNAPPMMGGQRIFNDVNALDLLFNCPFNIDVTPYIIDECDIAIGVLSDKNFEYPEEIKNKSMRKFDEDDVSLFESLIAKGEKILERYENEQEENLVNSKAFHNEYDQWRTDVFRLFDTHFDFKNDAVFEEIATNMMFIKKKRSAKCVDIILRVLKSCYRMPYKATKGISREEEEKKIAGTRQLPISININNNNSQNQEQKQEQDLNLLVDLLKNSIAPYQLEELKDIARSDAPVSEKRQSLIDKILSFGTNFGANVLANLLTNPQIIGLL